MSTATTSRAGQIVTPPRSGRGTGSHEHRRQRALPTTRNRADTSGRAATSDQYLRLLGTYSGHIAATAGVLRALLLWHGLAYSSGSVDGLTAASWRVAIRFDAVAQRPATYPQVDGVESFLARYQTVTL